MPDDLRADAGYEQDFFLWSQDQAGRLRASARSDDSGLDWDNLAEEIESLGRSQRLEVRRRLDTIYEHLLKLAFSPAVEPRLQWISTVLRSRREVEGLFEDSPSLRRVVSDWQHGDLKAVRRIVALAFEQYGEGQHVNVDDWSRRRDLVDRVLDDDFFPHPAEPD